MPLALQASEGETRGEELYRSVGEKPVSKYLRIEAKILSNIIPGKAKAQTRNPA